MNRLRAIALEKLKGDDYLGGNLTSNMKTNKEIKLLKMELMNTLKSSDNTYYGLSLESLILNH
ncbi:MAG: hypothetical protein ACE5RB_04220 [Nitrosopumilus sp.]